MKTVLPISSIIAPSVIVIVIIILGQPAIADELEKKLRENNAGFEDFQKDLRNEIVRTYKERVLTSDRLLGIRISN
jgi:hypothetical protein